MHAGELARHCSAGKPVSTTTNSCLRRRRLKSFMWEIVSLTFGSIRRAA